MSASLRISLLGRLEFELDGRTLADPQAVKARALMAYLAATGRAHSRQALAGLLWSDVLEASARHSLRSALMQVRQTLDDYVEATRQTIGLNAAKDIWVDVQRFEDACRRLQRGGEDLPDHDRALLREAVHLYQGEFLAGLYVPDAALFEEWMSQQREYYQRQALQALTRLATIAEARNELDEGLEEARRILDLDPLLEEAQRLTMRLLARRGERSAALAQFEVCKGVLADELGVEPDPATVALAEQIRSGAFQADAPAPARPAPVTPPADAAPAAPVGVPTGPLRMPALPPQGVFGRDELLTRIVGLLALDHAAPDHVAPVALQGMGGIGKTTTAIALGHRPDVLQAFPDGVLWASVGPEPAVRNILNDWGRALDIDLLPERDETACAERLRGVLHGKRMLLLVDDIWDIQHGAYFAVAGPRCRMLLTTRESPVAHALATRRNTLRVDVLQPDAALGLLHRLAPEAVVADEQSARRLCERLEYLPLALTLAGRMLANEADVPSRMQRLLGELIERRAARLQLLQVEGRLGIEDGDPVSLEAVLGMSIERLDQTDQARFALLAVFGAEPLLWEIEAAAHVWECTPEEAEGTVSRFVQRGLVVRRGDQYWTHVLLADYAAEMLEGL